MGARTRFSIRTFGGAIAAAVAIAVAGAPSTVLAAGQSFTFLQPGFTQSLFGTNPTSSEDTGVAFAPNGDVQVVPSCAGSGNPLVRFSLSSTFTLHGSTLHTFTNETSNAGCGLTNNPDGTLYTNTSSGVVNLDANTGAQLRGPFGPGGNALGIATDPQTNNLVYVGSGGTIQFVDPGFTTSGTFSTATSGEFIDGIAFDPTGNFLFMSNRTIPALTIIKRDGTLVQNVTALSTPDGIAFHAATPKFAVTNNLDGSMSRFDFPADDFTMTPTASVFASGGFRGDFMQVGSDTCLYLTQDGTRYDDGTTSSDNSIVKICGGFAPPVEQLITATGTTISATEGASFSGTVATFTDPNPNSTASEYSATIDWGDASSSAGLISGPMGGPFTVSGTHTYAEEGTYSVTVTITDVDNVSNFATATSTANVSDAALTASCATPGNSSQSFSGPTATFTDADPNGTVSDYTAMINWGDSTSSPGTVSGPDGGPFTVSGSHTYTSGGNFAITTTVKDVGGSTTSTACQVFISEPAIHASGTTFSPTEGASFTGTVATATDADSSATAGEYSATIDWGDASSSAGLISGPMGGPFTVSGTHTYAEEGTYSVTVTITDVDNVSNFATATSTANVSDAALTASCATPGNSSQSFSGPTATFTDADPNGTVSDYTAMINWGDSTSSPGTVSGPDGGPFTVSGSHTYTSTGFFTITTTIKDVGGSITSTACSVLIFAFAPGGGSFVIGDNNSANGTAVTFWGAKWWKLNSLSGGSAPASFKGFAEAPATPSCTVGWTADPGNSTPPPAGPLPAFMGVIVTSSVTQSGSTDSGNTVHIVIVQTNPGYQPNPGHPGTGTVVAQVC